MHAPQNVQRFGRITSVIRLPNSRGFSSILNALFANYSCRGRTGAIEEMAFGRFPALRYRPLNPIIPRLDLSVEGEYFCLTGSAK
jgi:hypothetical protein